MADLHDSTEHYLTAIFEIEEEGIDVKRVRIAERLGISAPSVTEHVIRMHKLGLIRLTDTNSIRLTKDGKRRAAAVVRRHRLAERLLVDVIGLDWGLAHEEADRWEHVISDAVEDKLVKFLNNPPVCPHGNPIPNPDGSPSATAKEFLKGTLPLRDVKEGTHVEIIRVGERIETNPQWLRFVSQNKLLPNISLVIKSHEKNSVTVVKGTRTIVIEKDIARSLYVRPQQHHNKCS